MPNLYIVRGLPGSGKSTWTSDQIYTSELNCIDTDWYEADMFFTSFKGKTKYNFNPKFLRQAHDWCYHNTLQSLYIDRNCYVSNTFTTLSEMQRYFDLVNLIPNLQIHVVELHKEYKSIHDVPELTLHKMRNRWHIFTPVEISKFTSFKLVK